ncbi:hypothetical protein NM688_g244 [Phlebia brevispora]|uniref:Uncharacterized protein n=1 Tax=Phlebia brevispora TaxID=194682 RepID=A0ACC1TF15_9APHY|nr:hypothetical protein NM688_g244 [Phlebia brevispora]
MRVKNVWEYVPVPAKLKILVDRVTFSRITLFYVGFSVINCVIQVVFQVRAFSVNAGAARFLDDIITQGNASQSAFAVLGQDLRMCYSVPSSMDASSCTVIWGGNNTDASATTEYLQDTSTAAASQGSSSAPNSNIFSSSFSLESDLATSSASSFLPVPSVQLVSSSSSLLVPQRTAVTVTVTTRLTLPTTVVKQSQVSDQDNDASRGETPHTVSILSNNTVIFGGINGQEHVLLTDNCLVALNWPLANVDDTKREDIAFIGFSIWVLGMSLVAVLNESPPHLIATFLTHQLQPCNNPRACAPVNLLPTYWSERARAEIPTLALNAAALLFSTYLSWKLMKSFGWQTFKRIGASLTMSRAYRSVLMLSIAIQLSAFFIVVTVSLWIDQVFNGEVARLTTRSTTFKAITISILVLVIPWLTLGWISVRREFRVRTALFLILTFGYLVGWSAMFLAPTFRWTFVTWRFFSVMATASVLLTLLTLVMGICCRLNFGKGLTRYLQGQEELPDSDFVPATLPYDEKFADEKVDFPSFDTPVPTFSAAYGVEPQMPPRALGARRILGPRFFATSAESFDPQPKNLSRQGSGSSQRSTRSDASTSSSFYAGSESTMGKRWIIE